ncbi:MAG: SDR family NAD(P)-dependent oxidoreductase, partial [Myxococcota bacterium]
PVPLDVTDDASVDACLVRVAEQGGLDAVVHNAGVAAAGLVETFTADVAQRIFDVNVFGPLRVQRACLPLLRQSTSPRVVYLSSTDGREVMPFLGLYNASKAALESLAEGWSYELNALGIRSVIVQPGTFPTTSILRNLLPPDAPERAEFYGDLAAAPEALFAQISAMVESGRAPELALVVDAVVQALLPDAPPRIVVDPSGFDGTERINAVCSDVQRQLLERCALSHLSSVVREGARRDP